jgi:hypothetical protein
MPAERPMPLPPRFPVREFQTPVYTDGFFTELISTDSEPYFVNGPPRRGALYSSVQGASANVIAAFPALYFLREIRYRETQDWVLWLWGTDPLAEDSYNASVQYTNSDTSKPEYVRVYTIRRDVYEANSLPVSLGQPLKSVTYALVTNGGSGYSKNTTLAFSGGGGSGATAQPVISAGVIISVIVTAGGGGFTSTPTLTAMDAGGGSGAVFSVSLQGVAAVMVDQKKQEFPEQHPLRNEYVQVVRRFQTLPGPILVDIVPDPELGIPVMTTIQPRSASDTWTCGEIAPIAFNISGATVAVQTVVSLSGYPTIPDIFVGEWVVVAGTSNTTPTLNGTWLVVAVNGNAITLDKQLTAVSGTVGGTMKRYSYAYVERRKTENANVVEMVTTRAATSDITQYNQSTYASRTYPFPDALLNIYEYKDEATTTNLIDPLNWAYSYSGGVGFKILPGFRGGCDATRLRVFSMGPVTTLPTNPATGHPYQNTVVIPAVGTVQVQGGSVSKSNNLLAIATSGGVVSIGEIQDTTSTSNTFKGVPIPPVLTKAYSGPIPVGPSGAQATFDVKLPDSIVYDKGFTPETRTGWTQGDIITVIDQPEKLRSIGVYMTTIWLIVAPYTTGVGPA